MATEAPHGLSKHGGEAAGTATKRRGRRDSHQARPQGEAAGTAIKRGRRESRGRRDSHQGEAAGTAIGEAAGTAIMERPQGQPSSGEAAGTAIKRGRSKLQGQPSSPRSIAAKVQRAAMSTKPRFEQGAGWVSLSQSGCPNKGWVSLSQCVLNRSANARLDIPHHREAARTAIAARVQLQGEAAGTAIKPSSRKDSHSPAKRKAVARTAIAARVQLLQGQPSPPRSKGP